jgi:hypothetical protein
MFSFLHNNTGNDINTNNQHLLSVAFPTVDDLPKNAQGYSTNNRYSGFPPLMCDGRCLVASWQPEAEVNNEILKRNNIRSNWEYRQYLTNNAADIMRRNFVESANDVGYYERNSTEISKPNVAPILATSLSRPFMYSSVLEPPVHLGNENTDLKTDYLTREQLNAQQFSPVVTQDELLRMTQSRQKPAASTFRA